jgi:hypothetical protein
VKWLRVAFSTNERFREPDVEHLSSNAAEQLRHHEAADAGDPRVVAFQARTTRACRLGRSTSKFPS